MNQDLVMMFSGIEDAKLSSDSVQDASADGVMAALYNQMHHDIGNVNQPTDIQHAVNTDTYKEMDCTILNADGITGNIQKFINESSEESNNLKVIDVPDSWNVAIMESNNISPLCVDQQGVDTAKHGYQLWECPSCSALFREKEVCELHVNKSHDFICGLCGQPFHEKETLESHIITHIYEIPGSSFQKLTLGNQETENVVKTKKILVPAESITTNSSLFHDVFKCMDCCMVFSTFQNLSKHKESCSHEVHSDSTVNAETYFPKKDSHPLESPKTLGNKFTCELCDQIFFTKNSLLLHMTKKHHSVPINNFFCSDCGASFRWKLSLQNHHIVDHGKKN